MIKYQSETQEIVDYGNDGCTCNRMSTDHDFPNNSRVEQPETRYECKWGKAPNSLRQGEY